MRPSWIQHSNPAPDICISPGDMVYHLSDGTWHGPAKILKKWHGAGGFGGEWYLTTDLIGSNDTVLERNCCPVDRWNELARGLYGEPPMWYEDRK